MKRYFFRRELTGYQFFPGIIANTEEEAKNKLEALLEAGADCFDSIDWDYNIGSFELNAVEPATEEELNKEREGESKQDDC